MKTLHNPTKPPSSKPAREQRPAKRRRKRAGSLVVGAVLRKSAAGRYNGNAFDASRAGRGNPMVRRRTSAKTAGAFFVPAVFFYGGWCGAGSRLAGSYDPVFHPRSSRHPTAVESGRVGSNLIRRSHPMKSPTQATTEIRQPSGEPTPPATINADSVRFDHAEGGMVALDGTTAISSLLKTGALVKTRRYRPEIGGSVTATDEGGLEIVAGRLDGAVDLIVDGLGSIGKLMALASEEMEPSDVANIGWLVCGLAELVQDARFEVGEIEYERERDNGARNGTP